jgi:hypothetical protein
MDEDLYGYRKNLLDEVAGFKNFADYDLAKMTKNELIMVMQNVQRSTIKIERIVNLIATNETVKERAELKRIEELYRIEQLRTKSLQADLDQKERYIQILETTHPGHRTEPKKAGRKMKWTKEKYLQLAADYHNSNESIRTVAARNKCSTATVQKAIIIAENEH